MDFLKRIGSESFFVDSITHNSFILFIVLREYISSLLVSDNSVDRTHCITSKEKINLYMLMYNMLKENFSNPFDILKSNSDQQPCISAYLKPLVQGRIERLRDYSEAVAYTSLSSFKNVIFAKNRNDGNNADDDDEEEEIDIDMDNEDTNIRKKFLATKDSVFGLFLRKFSLGFSSQSFEKMIRFLDSFYEVYDNEITKHLTSIHMDDSTKHTLMECSSAYNDSVVNNSFKRDQFQTFTRTKASSICGEIIESVGKIGGRPNVNLHKYNELLSLADEMYPELPSVHYASHIYALHKRNFIEAENELHAYIETCMASSEDPEAALLGQLTPVPPIPPTSLSSLTAATGTTGATATATNTTTTTTTAISTSSTVNSAVSSRSTCANLAVIGAGMHLNFGHMYSGKCLIKEALQKSLESESKDSLRHVKVTHSLLNSNTEPFRYDDQLPSKTTFKLNDVSLTEFRTKFWSSLDSGAEPYEQLITYFNSPSAISQAYFALCLLDLATMWHFYGYPNMATVLMQCIVNADCLEPCPNSDNVLVTAFANIIKEFNSVGLIETALKLSKICRSSLCRFPGQSPLLQACIEVELEQNLRSGYDLAQCDRLVNSLRLYCPWEAALRQAEVEQKRDNVSYTHDILRHIIDSIVERRQYDGGMLKQQQLTTTHIDKTAANSGKLLYSIDLSSQRTPFKHLTLPIFPEHTPVGGLCKLINIELRAHLSLIELLITLKLYNYAMSEIDATIKLCKQYKLDLGLDIIKLFQCATHMSMYNEIPTSLSTAAAADNEETNSLHNKIFTSTKQQISKLKLHKHKTPNVMSELNTSLEEILHRTDRLTKIRSQVFMSRVRLLHDNGGNNNNKENSQSSFIQMHMAELLKALNFYRQVDDRKRVLDILVLMATALNSMNEYAKRNEVSKSFHMLREHFGLNSTPSNRFTVDIL
ncbi:unnamed protein product [Trichobilharzia szidati]|nr:unnamed protein product [Trichobilharzia szidati]